MSTVRAHPRHGTRGVRRHLRIMPDTTRPHVNIHVYRRGDAPITDAIVRRQNAAAYSRISRNETTLVGLPPEELGIGMSDVLAHEELHHILAALEAPETSIDMDTVSNYQTVRRHGMRGGF